MFFYASTIKIYDDIPREKYIIFNGKISFYSFKFFYGFNF